MAGGSELIGAEAVDPVAARRQAARLSWRLLLEFQLGILPVAPALTYVATRLAGLEGRAALVAVVATLGPAILVADLAYIGLSMTLATRHALEPRASDGPGDRLGRLLRLPQRWWLQGLLVGYTAGGLMVGTGLHLGYSAPRTIILHCLLLGVAGGLAAGVPLSLRVQELVLPMALEEQRRTGGRPTGTGLLWMRQSWFIPLAFATMLFGTLVVAGEVLAVRLADRDRSYVEALQSAPEDQRKPITDRFLASGPAEVLPPTLLVAGGMLLLSLATSWLLSRRLGRSAKAAISALESTLHGAPRAVAWVSTDELGDLSEGISRLQASLAELPVTLGVAAMRLSGVGRSLDESFASQDDSLARQSAAVQETHVTVEEIRRTSAVAVERAQAVAKSVEKAAEIGRAGEAALSASAGGLESIRAVVETMRAEIARLAERARQIGGITQTVKDLADQSNMLALNAAIEAVRSGEHGKGFGVVAREIRSLADQSIQATARIRAEVGHVGEAVRSAVKAGDAGIAQLEESYRRVRDSSEQLRALGGTVREHAGAMRLIVAAIEQQNHGTEQIFAAVADLSKGMQDAVGRLAATRGAVEQVKDVSGVIVGVAGRYRAAG